MKTYDHSQALSDAHHNAVQYGAAYTVWCDYSAPVNAWGAHPYCVSRSSELPTEYYPGDWTALSTHRSDGTTTFRSSE
jgi:hypothetical protein